MEQQAKELAHLLLEKLAQTQPSARLLVGIAGIPASGKSTFAQLLADTLNATVNSQSTTPERAILVGLDGWHLTRAKLDAMPDPKLAHDRRGIHWTFDGPSYISFVQSLRIPLASDSSVITAPSFDHALKDPTPDAVSISPFHRIVIIEGLYTFLSIEPWNQAGLLLDERWFINCPVEKARNRLIKRHVLSGVAKDTDEATWRAEENDLPNGAFILANRLEPTKIVESLDEPTLLD